MQAAGTTPPRPPSRPPAPPGHPALRVSVARHLIERACPSHQGTLKAQLAPSPRSPPRATSPAPQPKPYFRTGLGPDSIQRSLLQCAITNAPKCGPTAFCNSQAKRAGRLNARRNGRQIQRAAGLRRATAAAGATAAATTV
eukprot:353631-Chlamydomonas_euryale.AAC.10